MWSVKWLTVFESLETEAVLRPSKMEAKVLKLPMLKHSFAVSIQYSAIRILSFFTPCCKSSKTVTTDLIELKSS